MVAIFTGAGTGFDRGSAGTLGSGGLLGSVTVGRSGEQLSLNAATGNLLISQRDEFLVGRGPDGSISRTYNSLGDLSDENGDNWRQSTDRRVYGLTGTLNTAGSTIKRASGDGSVILYTWQTINSVSAYWATDGAGAYDSLAQSGTGANTLWTWTDGDSQSVEKYGAYDPASPSAPTSWRITSQADTAGNSVAFTYTGANLTKVQTADGSYLQYSWSGNDITLIVTGYTDLATNTAKTLTRTRYGYDAYHRLTTVTTDLSPDDSIIGDGKTYVATYSYKSDVSTDAGFHRIASISETDGSLVSVDYDASGRVIKLTQAVSSGVTRITGIAYNAGYTEITDPLGAVTRLDYDAAGQLTRITTPPADAGGTAQTQRFAYNSNGDVLSVTDALGATTTFTYDASGNVLTLTDRLQAVVTRTYGARNELLTETRTGADGASAGARHTTRYVYDDKVRLLYTISAEGRVTKNTYDTFGNLTAVRQYTDISQFYNVAGLAESTGLTLTQMTDWESGITDKSSIAITQYGYDARGNLQLTRNYSGSDAAGNGIGSSVSDTNYVYDQAGQLLSRMTRGRNAETFVYDGLGRVSASIDLNGATTNFQFNDNGASGTTSTVVTLMNGTNGYVQTSTYNRAGELISSTDTGANTTSGIAEYSYDQAGRLRVVKDATGRKSYVLYDKLGRKVGDVDAYGNLIEYRYDANNRLIATIRYGKALISNPLATAQDPLAAIDMGALRPLPDAADLWNWKVYDAEGRTVETIDGDGGVTTYQYDAGGRLVGTTGYANKLTSTQLAALKSNAMLSNFYTNPNDVSQWQRIGASLIANGTINGSNAFKVDVDATGTPGWVRSIQLIPVAAGETLTLTMQFKAGSIDYLNFGMQSNVDGWGIAANSSAVISGPGAVTRVGTSGLFKVSGLQPNQVTTVTITRTFVTQAQSVYSSLYAGTTNLDGTIHDSIILANPVLQRTTLLPVLPVADPDNDSIARKFYDKDGLLIGVLDGEGYLSRIEYDKAGRKIAETSFANATTQGLRATGSFNALVTSVGNSTQDRVMRYVYDGQGQLRYQIDTLNRVTEYVYPNLTGSGWTAPGAPRQTIRYAGTLGALANYGFAAVKAAVAALPADPNNRSSFAIYDAAGRLGYAIDASGAVTGFTYDILGHVTRTVQYATLRPTASAPEIATMDSWATTNAGNVDNRVARAYYTARGELFYSVDAGGYVSSFGYDAEGRLVSTKRWDTPVAATDTTTLAMLQALATGTFVTTGTTYDDDGRVKTTTDELNVVTTYSYNNNGTQSGVERATGTADVVRTRFVYDNAGRVLQRFDADGAPEQKKTEYTYDGLGNQLTVKDALGNLTTFTYDRAGQVETRKNALNEITTYQYDAFGNVVKLVDPLLYASYNYYDQAGRLIASRDAEGYVTQTSYTIFGEVASVTRRANKANTAADVATLPGVLADPQNDRISYFYYDKLSRVTTTRDAESYVTETAYNAFGNVVSVMRRANQATNSASTTALPVYTPDSAKDRVSYAYYDRRGQVVASRDAENYVVETAYNARGDVVAVTRRATRTSSPASTTVAPTVTPDTNNDRTTYTYYDKAGQVTATRDGENYVTEFGYNARGDVISVMRRANKTSAPVNAVPTVAPDAANDQLSINYYDKLGRVTTMRDAEGYVVETSYDAVGNITRVARRANKASNPASTTDLPTVAANTANDQISYTYYDKLGRVTTARDAENYVTEIAYNANGDIISTTRRANTATNTASVSTLPVVAPDTQRDAISYNYYDKLGRVTTTRDAENYVTEIAYNAMDEVVSTMRRANQASNPASTSALPVVTADPQKDAIGYRYYDRLGRVTTTRDAESYVTRTGYTAFGEIESITRYANTATNAGDATVLPVVTADPARDATTGFVYDKRGQVAKSTDALGFYESYTYNAFGDRDSVTAKTSGTMPAAGAKTTYSYDKRGLLLSETLPINSVKSDGTELSPSVVNKFEYDARGNMKKRIEAFGLPEVRTTRYNYDRLNRLTDKIGDDVPTGTAGTLQTPIEHYDYDSRGNLIESRDAAGARTLFRFDRLDRKTGEINAVRTLSTYEYDARGNVKASKVYGTAVVLPATPTDTWGDPGGEVRLTTYEYDRANRRTATQITGVQSGYWNGSSYIIPTDTTLRSEFTYDANDNVVKATDANGSAVFSYYDRLNRKTASVDQEGYLTKWEFDAEGNVKSERRYSARTAGTPVIGTPPSVTPDSVNDRETIFTYDKNGRRKTEERSNVVAYTVSASGQLSLPSTLTAIIRYEYNGLGQVTRKIEATGDALTYSYDGAGRLSSEARTAYIDQTGATVTPTLRYFYNGLGDLTRTQQGGAAIDNTNDHITRYFYDQGGRLIRMADANNTALDITAANSSRNYFYDIAGRKIGESYTRIGSDNIPKTEGIAYQYDAAGRLTQQSMNTVSGTTWTQVGDKTQILYNTYGEVSQRGINGYQEQFDYDLAGRVWRTNSGDGVWRFSVYDKNGNRTLAIESEGTDLAGKTLSEVLDIARNGGNPIGSTYVDGINVMITQYERRNLGVTTIQAKRQLSAAAMPIDLKTTRDYNAFGEVIWERDPSQAAFTSSETRTNYSYNTMGRLVSKVMPLISITAANGAKSDVTPTEYYRYDISGRMIGSVDANGNVTTRVLLAGTGYATTGGATGGEALVSMVFNADNTRTRTFYDMFGNARILRNGLYDSASATLNIEADEQRGYDAMGNLTSIIRRGALLTESYRYDVLGQRTRSWNSFYGAAVFDATDYDAQGRVISTVNMAGDRTTTTYSWNGALPTYGLGTFGGWTKTTITDGAPQAMVETTDLFGRMIDKIDNDGHNYDFTYDKAGRLITRTNNLGENISYTYLNTGLVSGQTGTQGTAAYSYNANGNRLTETYARNGTTYQNAVSTYDALGRLTSVIDSGAGTAPSSNFAWEYDAVGNIRLTRRSSGASPAPSTFNDVWYLYDEMNRVAAKGPLYGRGSDGLSMRDANNLLVRNETARGVGVIKQTRYTYDAAGRVATQANTNMLQPSGGGWMISERRTYYIYRADGALMGFGSAEGMYVIVPNLADQFVADVPVAEGPGVYYKTSYTRDELGRSIGNGTDYSVTYNRRNQVVTEFVTNIQSGSNFVSSYVTTTNTYGAGGLLSSSYAKVEDRNHNDAAIADNETTYEYSWADGSRIKKMKITPDTGQPGSFNVSDYYYDTSGYLTSVVVSDGNPRTISYINDISGQVIERWRADGAGNTRETVNRYFNGEDIAQRGIISAWLGIPGGNANDQSYQIATEDLAGGNNVTTVLSRLARQIWGDASLWYKIAEANGLRGDEQLVAGQLLTIPAGVQRVNNNNDTFTPYDPNAHLGDVNPTTPQPQAQSAAKGNKCGVFGVILLIAIAVAVTALTYGSLTAPATATLTSTTLTAGSLGAITIPTVTFVGGGALAGGGLAAIAAGAIAGIAGSVVSQGVGLLTGIQNKFDWKGAALAGLSGGIAQGIGQIGFLKGASGLTGALQDIGRGVLGNIATQGIATATGLQSRFSWTGVVVGGAVGGAAGAIKLGGFEGRILSGAAGAIAGGAVRSLLDGSDFGDNVLAALPDVIGSTIGEAVAKDVMTRDSGTSKGTVSGGGGGAPSSNFGGGGGGFRMLWDTPQDQLYGGGGAYESGDVVVTAPPMSELEKLAYDAQYFTDLRNYSLTRAILNTNWGPTKIETPYNPVNRQRVGYTFRQLPDPPSKGYFNTLIAIGKSIPGRTSYTQMMFENMGGSSIGTGAYTPPQYRAELTGRTAEWIVSPSGLRASIPAEIGLSNNTFGEGAMGLAFLQATSPETARLERPVSNGEAYITRPLEAAGVVAPLLRGVRLGSIAFEASQNTVGRGFISGDAGELFAKARAAAGGDLATLGEINAAKILRAEGTNVHFRKAAGDLGIQGERTSDFLVGGEARTGAMGVHYEVVTPSTGDAGRISGIVGSKVSQADRIILNLDRTSAAPGEFDNIIKRVNNIPGLSRPLQEVIIVQGGRVIVRHVR